MNDFTLDWAHSARTAVVHRAAATWFAVAMSICLAAGSVQARCGDNPGDADAIAMVRADLDMQCPCAFAQSRSAYLSCSGNVIDAAVSDGTLPRECKSTVRRCQSKSTCGRPGSVTCCRTTARGTRRCAVKRSPSRCTAPRGGSACISDYASCCDSCGASGCNFRPTPTPLPTPTVPPMPEFCQEQIGLPSLATVPFSTGQGSPDCASNPPAAPISGQVEDGSGNVLKQLGVGCLYTGTLPGSAIPDGGVAQLSVTGISGLTVTLGPSDGNGSFDCTNGSGPDAACLNGAPGLDGNGSCMADTDCDSQAVGVCGLRPNCYFGPPVPIGGLIPACTINSFLAPLCGSVDLASTEVTMATALTAAIFLTGDAQSPCPQCLDGVCTAGRNVGEPCTPVGSAQTSVDCPPLPSQYRTKLRVVIPELTTGTAELADSAGLFCPEQTLVGAFGQAGARRIVETGSGIGSGGLGAPFATTLVGVFCLAQTADPIVNLAGNFPAAGAFSSVGEIDLSGVLGLP